MREVDEPVEHTVNLGTRSTLLAELPVKSKAVKPKGKPGRKKKVDIEAMEAAEEEGNAVRPADGAAGARRERLD